jgi:hypothetical protein
MILVMLTCRRSQHCPANQMKASEVFLHSADRQTLAVQLATMVVILTRSWHRSPHW